MKWKLVINPTLIQEQPFIDAIEKLNNNSGVLNSETGEISCDDEDVEL